VTPETHLDRLGEDLRRAGWSTVRRYDRPLPLLRVFSPALPEVGESVWVKPGVGGVPWFIASTCDPLSPCHDLLGARIEVSARLAPLTAVAPAGLVGGSDDSQAAYGSVRLMGVRAICRASSGKRGPAV
jgi:hypothetical protein